jgi:hypothetical protein
MKIKYQINSTNINFYTLSLFSKLNLKKEVNKREISKHIKYIYIEMKQ